MATTAQVVDGKIVANYSSSNSSKSATGNKSLNKDAFLNILVAEMQYQDPLEPSSNTEWVTQMASFSQIEEIQNLGTTFTQQSAANLVGKRVIITTTSSTTGQPNYVTGIVECVEKQSDGIYLSVNGYLYKYDSLYAVVDEDYYKNVIAKEGTTTT